MVTVNTLKRGASNGLSTILELSKVILPVFLAVTILKHTMVLYNIAIWFKPIMKVFGLPGEAAIVLVLGNILNIYAALGAIASLELTVKQVTIIAVMLSFSHALPVETAVTRKIGVSVFLVLVIRLGLAIILGIVMNIIM